MENPTTRPVTAVTATNAFGASGANISAMAGQAATPYVSAINTAIEIMNNATAITIVL